MHENGRLYRPVSFHSACLFYRFLACPFRPFPLHFIAIQHWFFQILHDANNPSSTEQHSAIPFFLSPAAEEGDVSGQTILNAAVMFHIRPHKQENLHKKTPVCRRRFSRRAPCPVSLARRSCPRLGAHHSHIEATVVRLERTHTGSPLRSAGSHLLGSQHSERSGRHRRKVTLFSF